ncbi:hypothetical protein GQ55_6G268300 [Panicum hallii var. hallii]|uniref:Uncharacterized protein n=1 Tax=Panicum hallii var. hallii TaxID=1504633 RepID=A0A2T7DA80_9POAL|nr:hypothetical protein GQ55_6G268300 [Panicum hallii var. hallii]
MDGWRAVGWFFSAWLRTAGRTPAGLPPNLPDRLAKTMWIKQGRIRGRVASDSLRFSFRNILLQCSA